VVVELLDHAQACCLPDQIRADRARDTVAIETWPAARRAGRIAVLRTNSAGWPESSSIAARRGRPADREKHAVLGASLAQLSMSLA
jgi:hypothetical protein